MANYLNITGWRHTGFDIMNRPYSPDVLAQDEFRGDSLYFQMQGIAVSREDMYEMRTIRLQGSVKDLKGTQSNDPNDTGVLGPNGPFYSWEEVDYIRVVRTGYPGDEDYVDISGNMDDPWNAPHEGKKLFVAYYFVVGVTTQGGARDVVTLHLQFDEWTSLNVEGQLHINGGIKTRGHITDAEDAATYNVAPEPIGLMQPLVVSQYKRLLELSGEQINIVNSGADLTQYTQVDAPTVDGMTAEVEGGGKIVVPYVRVSRSTKYVMMYPRESQPITIGGVGGYNQQDGNNVAYNINLLFSAGQLELQDSYSVPKEYMLSTLEDTGFFQTITGNYQLIPSPVNIDIGSYPRKADYLYGSIIILSESTGNINAQPFANLSNTDVVVWSCPMSGGAPYARFVNIKNAQHAYDQSVMGMSWISKSIALQGASGSFWANVNNAFSQQNYERDVQRNAHKNDMFNKRFVVEAADTAASAAIDAGRVVSSGADLTNYLQGGKKTFDALDAVRSVARRAADMGLDYYDNSKQKQFNASALAQENQQNQAQLAQALWKTPTINFVPSLGTGAFLANTFSVYVLNVGTQDRANLKRLLKRNGYSNLYKPLNFGEINVKQKVNYIEAMGVNCSHENYPMRVVQRVSALLNSGLYLWNTKPSPDAFDNNPDREG